MCKELFGYGFSSLLKVLFVLKSVRSFFIPIPHFTFLKVKQEITSRKMLGRKSNVLFLNPKEEEKKEKQKDNYYPLSMPP